MLIIFFMLNNNYTHTEEVMKSDSLLLVEKDSVLSKIGDQRFIVKCRLFG